MFTATFSHNFPHPTKYDLQSQTNVRFLHCIKRIISLIKFSSRFVYLMCCCMKKNNNSFIWYNTHTIKMDKSIVFYTHLKLTVFNLYSRFKCYQLISSRKQNPGEYNKEVLNTKAKKKLQNRCFIYCIFPKWMPPFIWFVYHMY